MDQYGTIWIKRCLEIEGPGWREAWIYCIEARERFGDTIQGKRKVWRYLVEAKERFIDTGLRPERGL